VGQPSRPPLAPKVDKPGALSSISEKQREMSLQLIQYSLNHLARDQKRQKKTFFFAHVS